jgi:hypothetical protein
MSKVTRTLNPLHFEDLEPHRFEDLVRQLVYDFREWRSLEATGRQGSDQGFDIRGWEVLSFTTIDDQDEQSEEETPPEEDRIWLIQCKREKSITPKKLIGYLDEIKPDPTVPLYGLIIVAACDLSKKTRDNFRRWCVEHNISEYYLWGRAEVEDMLFQPKYDHLLFAYFGISIKIRKRSVKTRLRGLISTKRQAIRHLGNISGSSYQPVLLRDPEASEYPYKDEIKDFDEHPKWRVYDFMGHYHSGLEFMIRSHLAYIDDEGVKWDYEKRFNKDTRYDDPWAAEKDRELEHKARQYWNKLSDANKGTLEIKGLIPYEDILAIDENGDDWFRHPHIYVRFERDYGPFSGGAYGEIITYNPTRKSYHIKEEDRIKYFPETYPDIKNKESKP